MQIKRTNDIRSYIQDYRTKHNIYVRIKDDQIRKDLLASTSETIEWNSLKCVCANDYQRPRLVDILRGSQIVHKPDFTPLERNYHLERILRDIQTKKLKSEYNAMVASVIPKRDQLTAGFLELEDLRSLKSYVATIVNVILSALCSFFMVFLFTEGHLSVEMRVLVALLVTLIVISAEVGLILILAYRDNKSLEDTRNNKVQKIVAKMKEE